MHCRWRTHAHCAAFMALMVALTLAGCAEKIDETIAGDVNNRAFTFASGVVFHPALADTATTLSFTNDGTTFTLASNAGTATGRVRFRPCSLTVDPEPDGSTYASFATGPQGDDVLLLTICDFDLQANVLILGNGAIVVLSSPAVALNSGS